MKTTLALLTSLLLLAAGTFSAHAVQIGFNFSGAGLPQNNLGGAQVSFEGMITFDSEAAAISGTPGVNALFPVDAMVAFTGGIPEIDGQIWDDLGEWAQIAVNPQKFFLINEGGAGGDFFDLNFEPAVFPSGVDVLTPPLPGDALAGGSIQPSSGSEVYEVVLESFTIAPKDTNGVPESGSTLLMLGMVVAGYAVRRRR